MQEILQRLENLETQIAEIKFILSELIKKTSENEQQNFEGYCQLAQAVDLLSIQIQSFPVTYRKE